MTGSAIELVGHQMRTPAEDCAGRPPPHGFAHVGPDALAHLVRRSKGRVVKLLR